MCDGWQQRSAHDVMKSATIKGYSKEAGFTEL
jgi:hypothetical protein